MTKTWRPWMQRELLRMEQLRLDGLTSAAIARELGRPHGSVRAMLAEKRFAYVGVAIRWLAVLMQPHTMAAAAAAMGTSYGAVKQAKRKLRRAGFAVPAAVRVAETGAAFTARMRRCRAAKEAGAA